MKKFVIKVEKINGHCSCGYAIGSMFTCQGMNTPDTPFCGGAYMVLFPVQVALHGGARFSFEINPNSKTGLACPDNGNVIFSITQTDI